MALFLSAFSLPADIKNHTIYTIVTKPVRPSEIVLGRILGFAAIGTRAVGRHGPDQLRLRRPRAEPHARSRRRLAQGRPQRLRRAAATGRTTLVQNHRHQVTLARRRQRRAPTWCRGTATTIDVADRRRQDDLRRRPARGSVHGPRAGTTARCDSRTAPARARRAASTSATSGRTAATSRGARWPPRSGRSHDVTPERFPDGLPLEMTIRVFRSYKGDIEKGILGSLVLRNPAHGRSSQIETFLAKDFYDRPAVHSPQADRLRPASRSTCSTIWPPTASWKSGCSASTTRSTSASPRPTSICGPATPRSP